MPFDFDTPVERAGTWSIRWDRYAGRDVVPLWVADTDFRAPPAVLDALQGRLQHGIFGYTSPPKALRDAIVERMARLYRWSIDADWLVFIPGVVPGLHHVARVLVPAGAHVLVPKPVYQHLKRAPELAGRAITELPLVLREGRWVYDREVIERAMQPGTRAFFLCNPQNPGGTVFTRGELAALAEATGGSLIVSDEIHCDLVLEPGATHVPIASLSPEISRRTVTLMSPNKAFNFPAAGCAWAIIEDAALRRTFARDLDAHALPSPSVFGYAAALAAYRDGAQWLEAQLTYLRANRDLVQALGLPMARVQATYLAWLDCSGMAVKDAHQHFLDHGVALSPGAQFGDPGFVRLNFGTQAATLRKALGRMRAALGRP